jgi:hypothetical protein
MVNLSVTGPRGGESVNKLIHTRIAATSGGDLNTIRATDRRASNHASGEADLLENSAGGVYRNDRRLTILLGDDQVIASIERRRVGSHLEKAEAVVVVHLT